VRPTQALKLDEPGYAFPMQLWPRAVQNGLRITEIPVRLIYNDPTRHFGGLLDDAGERLRHYMDVLRRELKADLGAHTMPLAGPPASAGAGPDAASAATDACPAGASCGCGK
jgi:hypothetical protein